MVDIIAYKGQTRIERFAFALRLRGLFPRAFSLCRFWVPQSRWDKALTIFLVIAIVGAIGTLAYVIAKPKVGERFTEFYILGLDGKAQDYPTQLALGEKAKVIVGIVNHEGIIVKYRLEVRQAQFILSQIDGISLDNTQKWEHEIEFALTSGQGRQKIDFWLYREGDQPYLTRLSDMSTHSFCRNELSFSGLEVWS